MGAVARRLSRSSPNPARACRSAPSRFSPGSPLPGRSLPGPPHRAPSAPDPTHSTRAPPSHRCPQCPNATFRAEHPFRPTHPLGFTNTCSPSRTLRAGPSLAASRPVAGRLWIGSMAARPRPARKARRGTRAGGARSPHAPSATLAPSSCWTNRPSDRRARPARATAPRHRRIRTASRCARSTGRAGPVRGRRATTTASHRSSPIARRASPAGPCADAATAAEHPPTAGVPAIVRAARPGRAARTMAADAVGPRRALQPHRRPSCRSDSKPTPIIQRRLHQRHVPTATAPVTPGEYDAYATTRPVTSGEHDACATTRPPTPDGYDASRAVDSTAAVLALDRCDVSALDPCDVFSPHRASHAQTSNAHGLGGSSPFPALARSLNATSRPIGRLV